MKRFFLIATIICFALTIQAQPPAGSAGVGDSYGEKISADGAISLKELNNKLSNGGTYAGKIVGIVKESCVTKGCWLTMELPDKTKMQVKFKDYGFFVPEAIVGKSVVLEGEAKQKIVTVNELKHYAEDAKKSKAEIDAITKPEKQVKFMANGVLVVK
mgnify:CR=1 FL=1